MKFHLACVLAAAAVLSLAACGGGGGSVSEGPLTSGEIRDLTGLSAADGDRAGAAGRVSRRYTRAPIP